MATKTSRTGSRAAAKRGRLDSVLAEQLVQALARKTRLLGAAGDVPSILLEQVLQILALRSPEYALARDGFRPRRFTRRTNFVAQGRR